MCFVPCWKQLCLEVLSNIQILCIDAWAVGVWKTTMCLKRTTSTNVLHCLAVAIAMCRLWIKVTNSCCAIRKQHGGKNGWCSVVISDRCWCLYQHRHMVVWLYTSTFYSQELGFGSFGTIYQAKHKVRVRSSWLLKHLELDLFWQHQQWMSQLSSTFFNPKHLTKESSP